jgi:hypothetical protein
LTPSLQPVKKPFSILKALVESSHWLTTSATTKTLRPEQSTSISRPLLKMTKKTPATIKGLQGLLFLTHYHLKEILMHFS